LNGRERRHDPLGFGHSDALVDRECLLEVSDAVIGVVCVDEASADPLKSVRFLKEAVHVAGERECLVVALAHRRGRGNRAEPRLGG
jgi:hypothetical protein